MPPSLPALVAALVLLAVLLAALLAAPAGARPRERWMGPGQVAEADRDQWYAVAFNGPR